ncbi:MAG: LacI family DNA-binding transcriptional regulator [Pseudomonadota bacterium]
MSRAKIRNMEEFAAAVGVSRPTVSKYFNDPNSVRSTTRTRIEAALERYEYRPNIYAINQNRRHTKSIGIVVPYLADPFFAEMVRVVERQCVDAGFSPSLFSAYGERSVEVDILDSLRSLRPAGVLMAPLGRASDKQAIEAFCRDVPTVLFDSNIEGLGQAFIGSDNHSFVSQTVDYLTRTGDAPFLFEMRDPANPNADKRGAAFEHCMAERGLEPRRVQIDGHGWQFEDIGHRGALALLTRGELPSQTVLCSNDRLAIGFLSACYELGVSVGRDAECALRVASHDDHPFSRFTCPALTTAAHGYAEVSKRAVETLFRLIEAGGCLPDRDEHLVPARLIIRESA